MLDPSISSTMADNIGRGKHRSFDVEVLYRNTIRTKSYEDVVREFQENPTPIGCYFQQRQQQEQVHCCPLPADRVRLAGDLGATGEDLGLEDYLPDADRAPLHRLVRDYIQSGTKACDFCCLLLSSVRRARENAHVLRGVVRTRKCCDLPCEGAGATADHRRSCRLMFLDLVRVAQLDNPLSHPGLVSAPATDSYAQVIPRLRSLQRRVERKRSGFVGFCMKAAAKALPAACGASRRGLRRLCCLAGLLDEAARGAYVLDREFHTLGRLLARVNEEIEHRRVVVREFLQGRPGRYPWREVMKLLQTEEGWLLEQLQELEEHAYLCLLIINRVSKSLDASRINTSPRSPP